MESRCIEVAFDQPSPQGGDGPTGWDGTNLFSPIPFGQPVFDYAG